MREEHDLYFQHYLAMISARRGQFSEALFIFVKNLIVLSSGGIFLVVTLLREAAVDSHSVDVIITCFMISILLSVIVLGLIVIRTYSVFTSDERTLHLIIEGRSTEFPPSGATVSRRPVQTLIITIAVLFLIVSFLLFVFGGGYSVTYLLGK